MEKFMRTLLASIGGGLLLGTGLKLGEVRATARSAADRERRREAGRLRRVLRRIRQLEDHLQSLEKGPAATVGQRRAGKVSSVHTEIGILEREMESLAAEVPFADAVHENTISQAAEGLQRKVIDRIVRLEEESSGHTAAVNELKECAARTEKSVQRLVAGLDRWLAVRPASEGPDVSRREDSR